MHLTYAGLGPPVEHSLVLKTRNPFIMKPSTGSRVLLPWLWSAAVVVGLRFLHPADLSYDLTWQIRAAQHLLAGKGLSFYGPAGPDLAEPAQLFTLTQFPCGYSLFAAALMAMGLSTGIVVKVLGAAGTMLGWWGWGKFAHPFFSEGVQRHPVWKGAGLAIAIASPLLFTPPWNGTDIFLWAAVPWVVAWVVRAADENVLGGWWLDGLAGAVCGLCLLLRYATLFLVVSVACLMLWQSRMRFLVLARRWACFGLGVLPALALQIYINHFLSNAPATPGLLTFDRRLDFVVQRVWDGVPLLSTANYPWVFWWPGRARDLFSQVAGPLPWQLGLTFAVFVLLVFVVKTNGLGPVAATRDPRIMALGLFVVPPLVLWGCMLFGDYDYVADRRYYWPILPLSVLVVYFLASCTGVTKRSSLSRILHLLGVVYLSSYIATSLVFIVLVFVPGERGSAQRAKLMAMPLRPWPSMAVTYELYSARRFVMELLKEQPDILLLTSKPHWFYADPTVDQSRLYALGDVCSSFKYLSGPARLVFLTYDAGEPHELWRHGPAYADGSVAHQRVDCFEGLLDLSLLQRFPEEGVKVLEARVPADMRVLLGPR